tara:strand:- start:537 stop:977 length:441 start_codon:yes stop_codon:yes gene_type:complete
LKSEITKLIEPIISSMGYEMWGLNITNQSNSLKFTLYIDSNSGINIADCEKVSNQVTHLLDTEDIFDADYVLEVSSPGLDRVLITKDHFSKYINEDVKVKLKWLVNNRKNIKGTIKNVTNEHIVINDNKEIFEIKYDSIDSARLKI